MTGRVDMVSRNFNKIAKKLKLKSLDPKEHTFLKFSDKSTKKTEVQDRP